MPIYLIDLLGAAISLLATYYFICLRSKAWPTSIVATLINSWLYLRQDMYGQVALEAFYFFSSCYGWYKWSSDKQNIITKIEELSVMQWCIIIAISTILFLSATKLFSLYTASNIVILDALTMTLSLVAQGLMWYRVITTWVIWFIVDATCVYFYLYKGIPWHSLLMLLYTTMAVIGYYNWRKQGVSS